MTKASSLSTVIYRNLSKVKQVSNVVGVSVNHLEQNSLIYSRQYKQAATFERKPVFEIAD